MKECPIKNLAFETASFKTKKASRECTKECALYIEKLDCCVLVALYAKMKEK
jgi:hypothetical protein